MKLFSCVLYCMITRDALSALRNKKEKKVEGKHNMYKENKYKGSVKVPGVKDKVILLAADNNYPPYAQLGAAEEDFPLSGFGVDFASGLKEVCPKVKIAITETRWDDCWSSNEIGEKLSGGHYHGCMTYTHAAGVRNRFLEFSSPIVQDGRAAGLIVPLKNNGEPTIDGNSDLSGLTVLDVVGWAPTSDNLAIVTNPCTGEKFSGYDIVAPSTTTDEANDDALKALLDGEGDAIWIYADMADSLKCDNAPDGHSWDCTLWDGLGTEFAYIQTGIFDWQRAGTTLAMSKKGSGIAEVLNPCIDLFFETKSYFQLCDEYDLVSKCFPNEYFPDDTDEEKALYDIPTNELTSECSEGYCKCP